MLYWSGNRQAHLAQPGQIQFVVYPVIVSCSFHPEYTGEMMHLSGGQHHFRELSHRSHRQFVYDQVTGGAHTLAAAH